MGVNMKSVYKLFVILVLAALISFSFAACNNPTSSGGGGTTEIKVEGPTLVTLADKLNWLDTNAESDTAYVIEVTADEPTFAPWVLSYPAGVSIRLKGSGSSRTIRLSTNGSLFTVYSGVTLILDNNINLVGKAGNDSALVYVDGILIMNSGATISGNTNSDVGGGGVLDRGTFTMNGGTITYNHNDNGSGGGVVITNNATFTMSGGEISNNTAYYGGGVAVESGTFTMSGKAKISGNTTSGFGGGVLVYDKFTMNGGTIASNAAGYSGGGVCINNPGTFTKNRGTIYGSNGGANSNTASLGGHAVYANVGGTTKSRDTTSTGTLTCDPNGPVFTGEWDN